jgi:hypothetical protein
MFDREPYWKRVHSGVVLLPFVKCRAWLKRPVSAFCLPAQCRVVAGGHQALTIFSLRLGLNRPFERAGPGC